jgi:YHS domain-containing protein
MKTYTFLLLTTLISIGTFGQTQLRKKHFNQQNNIAVQGYDVVAYFTKGKAIEGSKEFAAFADGITYYFSSAANKDLFIKDYKKYEPQYGGWCAYAMGANGDKVEVDPETFKVVGGKLYLFYHSFINNTLPKWNADEVALKAKADKNWTNIFR